jgi:anti-anti-sigma factor
VLVIEGELDLAAVERFNAAIDLCLLPEGDVVLDLHKLEFIDGTGIQAVVDVAERLPEGGKLVLDAPAGMVLKVLRLLRTDQHPKIVIRLPEACA